MTVWQSAVDNVVARLTIETAAARQQEQALIADAFNNHTSMHGNYWQHRWQLEQQLKTALQLQEAFHEQAG
jgi:hypothetical protein